MPPEAYFILCNTFYGFLFKSKWIKWCNLRPSPQEACGGFLGVSFPSCSILGSFKRYLILDGDKNQTKTLCKIKYSIVEDD